MFIHIPRGRALTLPALLFGFLLQLNAEPPKSKALPERVITATKTETERWRTASSVTVIDRKKIDEQQLKMVPDALRQVPGLVIADRGTPGSTNGIFLRGTNSDQTLVVIDGRPVPANLAGLYNIETMTLDNVERIEVLRGPAASLYGGKTLGGVINIITRSGRGLEKPQTTLSWEGGSYGWSREGLGTRGSAGIYDWSLELSRTDTQGYRINSQMQLNNAAAKFGAQLANTLRFDLDLRYYNADVGDPFNATGFGANDPDNHVLTEFWSISPRLVWETTDRWTQTLTYQFGNFRQAATGYNFGGGNNRITSRSHFWEYQSVFKATDWWTITAGAWLQDLGYSRYNNDAPGLFNPGGNSYDVDQAETNWAVFLQSQAEILPGWNVLGGIRHDEYSDFGDATTWRAGTSWRMPWTQTVLHANYGTAFAPASPQNREAALFGNPAFNNPERSKGFEFGIEQPFANNKATVSLTYFRNNIRNLIVFDPNLFLLQQINQARTQGLEAAFNWQPCDSFGFSAQYTYLDADDLTAGTRLVRRPRHTISGDVWVKPVPKFRIGLGALYIIDREDGFGAAQRDVEDYLRLRLTASYNVCDHLDIFARVENLLGERYSEVLGFPAMRTGAYAGFRLRF
ncbi:MAG: TonB-dependent receptor [Verrucomicrobiaceae bacterium]